MTNATAAPKSALLIGSAMRAARGARADERHNDLFVGMARPDWLDLISLFFEGFEIALIDVANDINKDSALGIGCVNRDSLRPAQPSRLQTDSSLN
jgi:hypothetical protein